MFQNEPRMYARNTLLCLLLLGGCPGDVSEPPPPADASPTIDGAMVCVLPSTVTTCTVGQDAPCAALCSGAYCYAFGQVGTVCTQSCVAGTSGGCPDGWSCNNMGRCRPPDM